MALTSGRSSGLKMIISSRRFKNSGRYSLPNSRLTCVWSFLYFSSSSPSPLMDSKISRLPMLLVMTSMAFVKSTVLPLLSVKRPSSKTWSKMLKTSGCAFSISSNNTSECGFVRTASVSCPPSPNPMYPGGGPINLLTECDSMYSLMSMRTIAFSAPKYV